MKIEQAMDVFQSIKIIRGTRPQFVENAVSLCMKIQVPYPLPPVEGPLRKRELTSRWSTKKRGILLGSGGKHSQKCFVFLSLYVLHCYAQRLDIFHLLDKGLVIGIQKLSSV